MSKHTDTKGKIDTTILTFYLSKIGIFLKLPLELVTPVFGNQVLNPRQCKSHTKALSSPTSANLSLNRLAGRMLRICSYISYRVALTGDVARTYLEAGSRPG